MPPDNEGNFSAPGVHEGGPTGVQHDVFSILSTESDGRVVKWLPCILYDCSMKLEQLKLRSGRTHNYF